MKKLLFITVLLIIAGQAFAQSWTQGQYTEFKGVIANEVLRLPRRDTVALGGNKDSIGQVVFRMQDSTAYIKTPTGWKAVGSGKPLPDDQNYLIDEEHAWVGYYDIPAIAGKRFRYFRNGILQNYRNYRPKANGGIELVVPDDLFVPGEDIMIVFY